MVTSDSLYHELKKHQQEKTSITVFTGYNLVDKKQLAQAQKIYYEVTDGQFKRDDGFDMTLSTQDEEYRALLEMMGIIIFVAAFLGLAFLLTTGSILYFKQMSEAEDEAPQFAMLRKIGFTEQELMRGVRYKQLFNFGFPLLIGICHSFFAIKAGWILFGVGYEKPFMTVLAIYIVLYLLFAFLTMRYYRSIVAKSL